MRGFAAALLSGFIAVGCSSKSPPLSSSAPGQPVVANDRTACFEGIKHGVSQDDGAAACRRIIADKSLSVVDRGTAHCAIGGRAARAKEHDRALTELSEAIAILSESLEIHTVCRRTRASVYKDKKDFDSAILDAEEAIRQRPSDFDGYMLRAEIHAEEKHHDLAAADLTKALRLMPGHSMATYRRAVANLHNRDYNQAVSDASEFMKATPDSIAMLMTRGDAYGNLGRYAEAKQDYERILKLPPINLSEDKASGGTTHSFAKEQMASLATRAEFDRSAAR